MVDVWDLQQYVEANPDDVQQRWRLAKKLYMAWEYRLALDNLLILKNEWSEKLNVRRYLAATYYRLKRYDEAVHELDDAIAKWPDELGLYEQKARALEVGGNKLAAAEVWEKIAELNPEHSFAPRAARILRGKEGAGDGGFTTFGEAGMAPAMSDGPMAFSSPGPAFAEQEKPCPNCGAMNNVEYERCWQCHAPLVKGGAISPAQAGAKPGAPRYGAAAFSEKSPRLDAFISDTLPLILGVAVVLLLTFSVYHALRALFPAEADAVATIPVTVAEYLHKELLVTRLILGGVLLLGWPLVLMLATRLAGEEDVPGRTIFLGGLFLGAVALAGLWLPWGMLPLILGVLAILSLAIVWLMFHVHPVQGALVWAIQLFVVGLGVLVLLASMQGVHFVQEMPQLFRLATDDRDPSRLGVAGRIPMHIRAAWEPTGLPELDAKVNNVEISVISEAPSKPSYIEIKGVRGMEEFHELKGGETKFIFDGVEPGLIYEIILTGDEGLQVTVRDNGIFDTIVGPGANNKKPAPGS